MHLLFLHSPPAVGKYTVARKPAALAGFELHHNHLAVDEVLKAHTFGTPGFVAERDRRLRDSGAFATPLIPRTDLRIDSGVTMPDAAARQIADCFQLP